MNATELAVAGLGVLLWLGAIWSYRTVRWSRLWLLLIIPLTLISALVLGLGIGWRSAVGVGLVIPPTLMLVIAFKTYQIRVMFGNPSALYDQRFRSRPIDRDDR